MHESRSDRRHGVLVADPSLEEVLRATLLPRGFAAGKPRGRFMRAVDGMRQLVGLRGGPPGSDGSAVYFCLENGPLGSEGQYELSPVAAFKNTWWWPPSLPSHDAATLVVSIENQMLAWFDAWQAGFDPAAAVAALHARLEPLRAAQAPFQRTGDTWWRLRGEVIDLLDVEPVGGGVFAFVHVANWHASLPGGFGADVPASVTRAASTTLGTGRVDGVPNTTLFHLGAGTDDGFDVSSAQLPETALRFFAGVSSAADVLAKVRAESRHIRLR